MFGDLEMLLSHLSFSINFVFHFFSRVINPDDVTIGWRRKEKGLEMVGQSIIKNSIRDIGNN